MRHHTCRIFYSSCIFSYNADFLLIKFKNNPNTIICFKTRLNNKYNIIVSIIGCFSGPVSVRPTAPLVTTQGKYPYFVTKFKGVANPFRDNPRGQS